MLLIAGGALAVLLLGTAAGLPVRLPGSDADCVPATDSVDVGFAQDMSDHHRQAVQMAAWERDRTTDPVLRQLAFDVESSQTEQIGRMQGWLTLWEQSPQAVEGHMRWNDRSGHDGHGRDATGRHRGQRRSDADAGHGHRG